MSMPRRREVRIVQIMYDMEYDRMGMIDSMTDGHIRLHDRRSIDRTGTVHILLLVFVILVQVVIFLILHSLEMHKLLPLGLGAPLDHKRILDFAVR